MPNITEFDPDYHLHQDMTNEADFANRILEENQDMLINLTRIAGEYAQKGDSPAFYVLAKAINLTLNLAQNHMKRTIAGMQGAMN